MTSTLPLRFAFFLSLVVVAAIMTPLAAQVPSGPGDWPQWRGPKRDGLSQETGLLKQWPADGPAKLWQVDSVGVGYSSLSIKDGRIFTQGDLDGVEHIIALDAKSGATLWSVLPEPVERQLAERVEKEMKQCDANGDGRIEEFEALARLGWNFNKSDAAGEAVQGEEAMIVASFRASRLMTALDKNGDNQLTLDEAGQPFRDTFAQIDQSVNEAEAEVLAKGRTKAFFASLDKDQSGQIDKKEAKQSLLEKPFNQADQKQSGADKGDELLTPEEVEAYLLKLERGRDGVLIAAELSEYYARALPGRDGLLTAAELRSYYGGYRNGNGDGPRGTPTVDGDRLFVEGGSGDLSCLEAASGKTLWHVNLKDFGGGRPGWGYCESPLVEGNRLIVTPGGSKGTVAALDKTTGEVVWQSASVKEGAHYSSPVVAELAGVRQVVQFANKSLFGVRLSDGQLLWNYSAANNGTANICTPIVADNHVFASSGYGTGGGLAQIIASGDGQRAEEVYFEKKMANHHGGIVLVGEHMYGFGNGGLICMHYLSGKIAWTARSVGKGSLTYADGMLYCLGENHEVALAEATPEAYREHGRFKLDNLGRPSWAHPVVAGGRLYLRNQQRLASYDVAGK